MKKKIFGGLFLFALCGAFVFFTTEVSHAEIGGKKFKKRQECKAPRMGVICKSKGADCTTTYCSKKPKPVN